MYAFKDEYIERERERESQSKFWRRSEEEYTKTKIEGYKCLTNKESFFKPVPFWGQTQTRIT